MMKNSTQPQTADPHDVGGEENQLTPLASTSLGSAVPDEVLLAPWGTVESTNGRFVVDDESARLALQAFEEHGIDLPIDYEHQTLGGRYAAPDGRAPAAGWIKKLIPEPGVGLMAHIEWTPRARAALAAREYRYLSPVAIIRKSDRKLIALHSAALTNKPAIVGMQPIVNRAIDSYIPSADDTSQATAPPSSSIDGSAVARRMSDAETAAPAGAAHETLHAVPPACTAAGSSDSSGDPVAHAGGSSDLIEENVAVCTDEAMARLRSELDLDPAAHVKEVLVAAGRRIAELDRDTRRHHAERRVIEAMRAGKLIAAQRSWALELIARDERLFDDWLKTAPVIVLPGATRPPVNGAAHNRRRRAAQARSEYRANPLLKRLTTEEAYAANAWRTTS
ncbi:MAG: phage protease [Phycisphaerae bacterium]